MDAATSRDHATRIARKAVLFAGNECQYMTIDQIVHMALRARDLGYTALAPKRANGTDLWFGNYAHLQEEHKAVWSTTGLQYIPWSYIYTQPPQYGLGFIQAQCQVLIQMQRAIGELQPDNIGWVGADQEAEFNNRPDCMQMFANNMAPGNDILFVTTWGDPVEQGWGANLPILEGAVNCIVPQDYNNWLKWASDHEYPKGLDIQTGVDMRPEFGPNNPVQIAIDAHNEGRTPVWVWEASTSFADPTTTHQITNSVPDATPTATPPPAPVQQQATPPLPPTPAPQRTYTVESGDELSTIAERLDIADWHTLYDRNYDAIEADARVHGHPNSEGGNLIFPGLKLVY